MKKMRPKPIVDVADIVAQIGDHFRCFGGGSERGSSFNPIVSAMRDTPAIFALGVDVRGVVEFVLDRAGVNYQ